MDDRKYPPASRVQDSVPIAADARLLGRRQVDACCFHGDELGQGLAAALRIMGFDLHGLQGGIEPGPEPGSPTRRNTDDIDPQ
jgi:hypothetical protein